MIKPLNAATTEKGRLKMRLIDADALIKKFKHAKKGVKLGPMDIYAKGTLAGLDYAIYLINNITTVEERKHGHWIFTNAHYYGLDCALYYYKCSICGELVLKDIKYGVGNYCLHCGAVMDEVAEDEVRQNK